MGESSGFTGNTNKSRFFDPMISSSSIKSLSISDEKIGAARGSAEEGEWEEVTRVYRACAVG
jgi:hypothetical protein